jgi:thioredoxin 1
MKNQSITKINSQEFVEHIIIKKADALVKVAASWNGAGQMLCKSIRELAEQHTEQITFFAVDYDPDSALAATYRVEPVPTLLFFKKGTLVDKLSGFTRKSIISEKLNQLLNQ